MHQRRQNEGIHEAVEVVEKLLQRELGHRQELSREGRLCAIHQLGGRNAIGLRVVGSCHHVLDAQGATEGRPRRGSELGSSVRGYSGRDPETGDPLNKGADASCCGGILYGVGGGPTVHHSEHVCVATYRSQRTHQVNMDVGEMPRRHVDALNRQAHVSGHLGSLAVQAA